MASTQCVGSAITSALESARTSQPPLASTSGGGCGGAARCGPMHSTARLRGAADRHVYDVLGLSLTEQDVALGLYAPLAQGAPQAVARRLPIP